jgi:prevent-host-death family protein
MKRASITAAKNQFSALLDRVRHGETVVIEDRGIPVAQLSPVAARSAAGDAGQLARLERQGIVRPAASPGAAKLPATSPPRPRKPVTLSQLVIAERREGW